MNIFANYTSQENLALSLIISINLLAFLAYGLDKFKAKRDSWRIPEANLLLLGLLGGGVGSLMAMVVFKHKLSKKKFSLGLPLIIVLNFFSFLYLFPLMKELI